MKGLLFDMFGTLCLAMIAAFGLANTIPLPGYGWLGNPLIAFIGIVGIICYITFRGRDTRRI